MKPSCNLIVCLTAMVFFAPMVLADASHDHGMHETYAVGEPVTEGPPDRIVKVILADSMTMDFDPPLERIPVGNIIRFEVINTGAISHEFSIGNRAEQVKHAEMMRKMPNMVHEDPTTVTVAAGQTKIITWKFLGMQAVVFACNIPGHFEAGMFREVAIDHDMAM